MESAKPERNEYSDLFIWNDNVWANEPGYRLISGLFQRFGCYMVNFFSHQPAINYGFNKVEYPWQHKVGSPEANKGKEFIESVMDYWLNLGVDGFRVDMADSLVKTMEMIRLKQSNYGNQSELIWLQNIQTSKWYLNGLILLNH